MLQFTVKVWPPKTPGRMFHLFLLHQLLNRDALFDVDNGDTSCYFMLAFSVRVRDGFAVILSGGGDVVREFRKGSEGGFEEAGWF